MILTLKLPPGLFVHQGALTGDGRGDGFGCDWGKGIGGGYYNRGGGLGFGFDDGDGLGCGYGDYFGGDDADSIRSDVQTVTTDTLHSAIVLTVSTQLITYYGGKW